MGLFCLEAIRAPQEKILSFKVDAFSKRAKCIGSHESISLGRNKGWGDR